MFRFFSIKNQQENQTRFLSQAIQLEESVNPAIIRASMMTISLTILAFIAWSALANINEVARTPGEIVPQGFQQVVQNLEGGIVTRIAAREGDMVDKGQILLTLDGTGAKEDLARIQVRQLSLSLQEERLRAYIEGRKPDFTAYGDLEKAQLEDQEQFSSGMDTARSEERKVAEDQLSQKRHALEQLNNDLETQIANQKITENLHERQRKLNRQGYLSDVQFLQTQQTLNTINGAIKQTRNKIEATQAELSEYESRVTSLDAKYRDSANERLDQLLAEKAENAQLMGKLNDRVDRLEVRAPAAGLIKGMTVTTVGSVVQPGQTLMEIIPMDNKMMVQVKIPPQHVGHLHKGQPVEVKFSSFDFSRYGVVPGELEQISATTFKGENGERYYQGTIKLDRDYVGHDPRNVILPGMTVMADIVTGRKTVLEYLLKPIHLAMQTAFTER